MDSKTDRELIELAAKAAGMSNFTEWTDSVDDYESCLHAEPALHPKGIGQQALAWNPLIDDGDAFRLAVHLGLFGMATLSHYISVLSFIAGYDKYTLMRRAIIMAAAKIGEGME